MEVDNRTLDRSGALCKFSGAMNALFRQFRDKSIQRDDLLHEWRGELIRLYEAMEWNPADVDREWWRNDKNEPWKCRERGCKVEHAEYKDHIAHIVEKHGGLKGSVHVVGTQSRG